MDRKFLRVGYYGVPRHAIQGGVDSKLLGIACCCRFSADMPLELGFWLGAKRYGTNNHRLKRALVLDKEDFRYQKFCSDIAGQDIWAHKNNVDIIITKIRNWLRNSPDYKHLKFPSAEKMVERYALFRAQLPSQCKVEGLNPKKLEFNDHAILVVGWLKNNRK